MKLNKYGIVIATASFLLAGCGGSSTKTVKDDGKYVIASVTDKKIYADDVFTKLSDTTVGKNAYFNAVLQKIVDTNFPIDDAMKTDADLKITRIKLSYSNQYGTQGDQQLKDQLEASGYKDIEDYREALIKAVQYSTFLKHYVENNFDTIFDDYYDNAKPRMISIISIPVTNIESLSEEESAKINEITALLSTSKEFSEIATEYSGDSSATSGGNLGIVDTTSGLSSTYGDEVETTALSLNSGEVSQMLKGSSAYYFIKCTNTDKETIKAKLKNVDIESPLLSYDSYLQYFAFQSYKLDYKDDAIKTIIEGVIEKALKERETTRGES